MATTNTGVVINELLCFVANKQECLPPETISQLCLSTFGEAEIESAKKQLYELCCDESTPRIIHRKGPKKNAQNLEDIIKLMHERGSDVPTFVALNLQALPPVTFNSIDVSALLNTIQKTQVEVDLLKQGLSTQAQTIKDLQQAVEKQAEKQTLSMSMSMAANGQANSGESHFPFPARNRTMEGTDVSTVSTMEATTSQQQSELQVPPAFATETDTSMRQAVAQAPSETVPKQVAGKQHGTPTSVSLSLSFDEAKVQPDNSVKDGMIVPKHDEVPQCEGADTSDSYADKVSAWKTMMVVKGKLKAVPAGTTPPATVDAARGKRQDSQRRKNSPVSGAAKDSGIGTVKKMAKEKYASIFASRFTTDVSDSQLKSYLEQQLPGHEVVVNHVNTRYNTYRSFHVWCACPNPSVLLKEEVWPEGAYVRWWKGDLPLPC